MGALTAVMRRRGMAGSIEDERCLREYPHAGCQIVIR
jgi:hypothetical protein